MSGRFNRDIHHRQSIRLQGYDYSSGGSYFVTICAWQRECLFGEISDGLMVLNEFGDIAKSSVVTIPDHFPYIDLKEIVIMPNHVHMILTNKCRGVACNAPAKDVNYYSEISPKHNTLAVIIRSFKSVVTREINISRSTQGRSVWQRNYHEHVIRNEKELFAIRKYIRDNPLNWADDADNPDNYLS